MNEHYCCILFNTKYRSNYLKFLNFASTNCLLKLSCWLKINKHSMYLKKWSFQRGNSIQSLLGRVLERKSGVSYKVYSMSYKVNNETEMSCYSLLLWILSLSVFQSSVFSFLTARLHHCSLPSGACTLLLIHSTPQLHVPRKPTLLVRFLWAGIKTAPALPDLSPRSSISLLACFCS